MSWYYLTGFFFTSLLFYAFGRSDGEKGNESGLIVWAIANTIVITWILATVWATR